MRAKCTVQINPTPYEMPDINTAEEAQAALKGINQAMLAGRLDADIAAKAKGMIDTFLTAFNLTQIETRIRAIEKKLLGAREEPPSE